MIEQIILQSTHSLTLFSPLWFRDPWSEGADPYLWPTSQLTGLHDEYEEGRKVFDLHFYPSGFL